MKKRFVILGCASVASIAIFSLSIKLNNETVIDFGKSELTKEMLYEKLIEKSGNEVLKEITENYILDNFSNTNEKDIENYLTFLQKENQVKTKEELMKILSLNEEQLDHLIKKEVGRYNLLKKYAKISEKDIKIAYESFSKDIYLNSITLENKNEIEKIKELTSKDHNLEQAAYKVKEDYYYSFKYSLDYKNEFIEQSVYNYFNTFEVGEVSEIVEKNGSYTLYEVVSFVNNEFEDIKFSIVEKLAAEKGYSIEKVLNEIIKENDIKIEDKELLGKEKLLF